MAASVVSFGTGEGVRLSTRKIYYVNGKSFNPSAVEQGITAGDKVIDYYDPWTLYNPTSSFSVASFQSGQEVVVCLLVVQIESGDAPVSGTMQFLSPLGVPVYTTNYYFYPLPGYPSTRWCQFIYTGIRVDNNEIYMNGTYTARLTGSFTNSQTFDVSDLDASVVTQTAEANIGYLWAQQYNLAYINYNRCRTYIMDSGVTHGSAGVANAGHVWVDNASSRLYYVDQYGDIRKSKLASRYRNWGDDSVGGFVGTANSGHIWCEYGDDDHFLYFVDYEGYVCRVGAGYLYGDSQ